VEQLFEGDENKGTNEKDTTENNSMSESEVYKEHMERRGLKIVPVSNECGSIQGNEHEIKQ